MKPIINPIWFYLCSFTNNIKTLFSNFWIIFLVIIIGIVVIGCSLADDNDDITIESITNFIKKWLKIGIPLSIILLIINIFIPSQETCYQMLVASMVTKNNIEYVDNKATDLIDYIIDKVDTMLNEEEAK